MSRPLSIKFASECAYAAYGGFMGDLIDRQFATSLTINDQTTMRLEPTTFNGDVDNIFGEAHPFYGASSVSPRTRMGYVIHGTGARRSEVLITFRGSNRKSDYFLIDPAAALGTSPNGFAVHGGFAKVFQSCLPDIERILYEVFHEKPFHTVHCTGHSMGGALATLAAEYFINTHRTPYLYTFGAPRVGLLPHTNYMKRHMGDRIYRYYYAGDLVTWLPMFPYVHLPGKRLITSNHVWADHNGYRQAKGLILAGGEKLQTTGNAWEEAERLINQGGSVGGGWGLESRAWRYFTKAFHKLLYVVGMAFGLATIPAITILDQIVASISYLVTQNPNRRPLIVKWMVGSFKALGKIVTIGKDKFVAMLKYLVSLMLSSIQTKTERELAQLEYFERAQRGRRVRHLHFT